MQGFLHDLEEDTNNPMDPQKLDEYVQAMVGTVSLTINGDVNYLVCFSVYFTCLFFLFIKSYLLIHLGRYLNSILTFI